MLDVKTLDDLLDKALVIVEEALATCVLHYGEKYDPMTDRPPFEGTSEDWANYRLYQNIWSAHLHLTDRRGS